MQIVFSQYISYNYDKIGKLKKGGRVDREVRIGHSQFALQFLFFLFMVVCDNWGKLYSTIFPLPWYLCPQIPGFPWVLLFWLGSCGRRTFLDCSLGGGTGRIVVVCLSFSFWGGSCSWAWTEAYSFVSRFWLFAIFRRLGWGRSSVTLIDIDYFLDLDSVFFREF